MIVTKEFLIRRYKLSENTLATTAAALGIAGASTAMPPKEDIPIIDRVLQGLGHAEHRGRVKGSIMEYDPSYYIRTGKPDPILNAKIPTEKIKHSTAYGPFQFTKSTIQDLSSRHKKLFSGTEDYVSKFIDQGNQMLKHSGPNDVSEYGYGKSGVLSGEEYHSGYMDMSRAAIAGMASDLKINLQSMTPEQEQRLIRRFRGVNPEKSYMAAYKKGQNVISPQKAQEKTVTGEEKSVTTEENSDHTVVSGDTIYGIARKYGKNPNDIIKANPQIKNPNEIKPNDRLRIPK